MQPPGEGLQRGERERARGEGRRVFFKRKPTLASLAPCLGAVEYLHLSPSLTPSEGEVRGNLGCPLCLSYALSVVLFHTVFEAVLFKLQINSPLLFLSLSSLLSPHLLILSFFFPFLSPPLLPFPLLSSSFTSPLHFSPLLSYFSPLSFLSSLHLSFFSLLLSPHLFSLSSHFLSLPFLSFPLISSSLF